MPAQDRVLLGRQDPAPFIVGFGDWVVMLIRHRRLYEGCEY
jgi:hypothetical protein